MNILYELKEITIHTPSLHSIDNQKYDLEPDGRELNYELFYEVDFDIYKIKLTSIIIDEGGHIKSLPMEKVVMLELKGNFPYEEL